MKKHNYVITAIASCSIIILSMGYSLAADPFDNYIKSFHNSKSYQGNFELINSRPITNREFQMYVTNRKLMADLNHQPTPSTEQCKHDFNKDQVLYLEAEKQNLLISDQEAREYANMVRSSISTTENASEAQNILNKVEQALEVTDDVYWNDIAPKQYKILLSIGKLKDHFIHDYKTQHPNSSQEEINNAWEKYGEQLLQNTQIQPLSQ